MLETIAVMLIVLWLLGLVSPYTMSGLFVITVFLRLKRGRSI